MDTLKEWLAANPAPAELFTQSLAVVAKRLIVGEPFPFPVKEFLDEVGFMDDRQLQKAIAEPPQLTGDGRHDAYLGALAEHLAAMNCLQRPLWSVESARFLNTFWFVSELKGFRPLSLIESPAAFRRRGIFVAAGSLSRC